MGELAGVQRDIRSSITVCIAVSVEAAAFDNTFSSVTSIIINKSPTQASRVPLLFLINLQILLTLTSSRKLGKP